jgi:hypothetical protein
MGGNPERQRNDAGIDEAMNQNFWGQQSALFAARHPIILEHPIAD